MSIGLKRFLAIHELGHMITHSNGTAQSRHMVEEEMLANSFAIAFWTYFGEEKLYALEEAVEYILSNITPPAENVHHLDFMWEAVDAGRFAEVFEFETYGWFQFSIVRDILRDRDSLDLARLLIEMTDSENIQAQPRQRLIYPNLGTDIVPIIVGDAISVLEEWGVDNLPDVYIAFSTDPNAHMYQYPMPRSLLGPNIEAGRVLRVARSLHHNGDFAESVESFQNTPQDYDVPVYTSNPIAAALLEYFAGRNR